MWFNRDKYLTGNLGFNVISENPRFARVVTQMLIIYLEYPQSTSNKQQSMV